MCPCLVHVRVVLMYLSECVVCVGDMRVRAYECVSLLVSLYVYQVVRVYLCVVCVCIVDARRPHIYASTYQLRFRRVLATSTTEVQARALTNMHSSNCEL